MVGFVTEDPFSFCNSTEILTCKNQGDPNKKIVCIVTISQNNNTYNNYVDNIRCDVLQNISNVLRCKNETASLQ